MKVPNYLFHVQPGDDLTAQMVLDIARCLDEVQIVFGEGVLGQYIPGLGTRIDAKDLAPAVFPYMWRARLEGDNAVVAKGALNGSIPWLVDDLGPLRPLDGLNEKGEAHEKPAPKLKLSDKLFDELGYSWVTLRAFIDFSAGTLLKAKDGGITLAQVAKSTWDDGGSLDQVHEDGRHYGDYPLFTLRRPVSAKTGFGSISIHNAHFNLQHRFLRGADDAPSRHLFWV